MGALRAGAGLVGMLIAAAAASCLLAGCATRGAGAELYGDWVLTAASDRRGAMDLTDIAATLSIDEEGARGDGPCNIITLEVDGGPGSVAVTIGAVTERACVDTEHMAIEGRYITVLSNVAVAEVDGNVLNLRGKSGELTFERD
ncbi:MAG: hypothetical protein JWP66_326 [Naasia sp.]|nr:hypothetical protein [Naasia sp.]